MEVQDYLKSIRRRLWLIIALVLVAVAGAYAVTSRQAPQYRTRTRLFLNPASVSTLLPNYVADSTAELAATYAEYMRTRSFGEQVLAQLDGDLTVDQVLEALSTRYVPSQFFDITATYGDPQTAQRLATTAADVFIAANLARQQAQQEQVRGQQDSAATLERDRLRELQDSLQEELDYYAERIASLEGEIAELEAGPGSQETDLRILELRGELIQNRNLRVQALSSLAQAQTALVDSEQQVGVDTAVVIDAAPLPTTPLPRQTSLVILLAAVGALGLGITLALTLEYLDNTVRTPVKLDQIYGMAALGVTGVIGNRHSSRLRQSQAATELVTLDAPRSPQAEAFRALRTNIQFANPKGSIRSLLVTSAIPGEGKTFIASNLAVIMAQAGQRVILVDADLRKPQLHSVFQVGKAPGFSNLIVDQQPDVEAVLQPAKVENLQVLTCGIQPPNPAELLGSPQAAEIMAELERRADVVIYDGSPVATVTDAVILSTRVDGVLQVVQAGKTPQDLVLQGKALLEKVGAPILGPVLTQVRQADLGAYGYYYYDSHGEDELDQSGPPSGLRPWQRQARKPQSAPAVTPARPIVESEPGG